MGTQGSECKHKCPIRTVTTFLTDEWPVTALLPDLYITYQTVAYPRLYEVEVEPALQAMNH